MKDKGKVSVAFPLSIYILKQKHLLTLNLADFRNDLTVLTRLPVRLSPKIKTPPVRLSQRNKRRKNPAQPCRK